MHAREGERETERDGPREAALRATDGNIAKHASRGVRRIEDKAPFVLLQSQHALASHLALVVCVESMVGLGWLIDREQRGCHRYRTGTPLSDTCVVCVVGLSRGVVLVPRQISHVRIPEYA